MTKESRICSYLITDPIHEKGVNEFIGLLSLLLLLLLLPSFLSPFDCCLPFCIFARTVEETSDLAIIKTAIAITTNLMKPTAESICVGGTQLLLVSIFLIPPSMYHRHFRPSGVWTLLRTTRLVGVICISPASKLEENLNTKWYPGATNLTESDFAF